MFSFLLGAFLGVAVEVADSAALTPATVVAAKQRIRLEQLASPGVRIARDQIRRQGIFRPNSLSPVIPGLHIPDYGASLTSTIYIRGLGSRMENPALALYIDDIPVLDKNAYDFDWSGIREATLLRGPQGTLYGRNSMGGLLSLRTFSAADRSGFTGFLEGGTAGTVRAGLSYGRGAHVFSAAFRRTDGYFANEYTGENCDPHTGGQFHWRWEGPLSGRTRLSHTLLLNALREGGFAYGPYIDGRLHPVAYNDEGSYRRLSLIDGATIRCRGDVLVWDATASVQLLLDRMRMDQDYTPRSTFTLEQRQHSGALTGEAILRPAREFDRWKPVTGVFAFARRNGMIAPVTFKQDGIQTLILDNANRNIPDGMGQLEIGESSFPVNTDLTIWTWNAALYHESVFSLGRWTLTAGLRLDYEGGFMDYDAAAQVHYRFVPTMTMAKAFRTEYKGSIGQHSLVLLPKVSALYAVPLAEGCGRLSLYGNLSKGFRGGGFNTQIFSDILQGRMMNGMMADLGVYLDGAADPVSAGHTVYKPEEAWNAELGIRYRKDGRFRAGLNLYRMDCRHQQLTAFLPGKSAGRMMTNAGQSESLGVEAEAEARFGDFLLQAAYGWCRARFRDYDDGHADYAGNRVPYVPEHTLFTAAAYRFTLLDHAVTLSADMRGAGPFCWNEDNSREEAFSVCLGGRIEAQLGKLTLYLRGDNLAGRQVRTFYFKSMGEEFFALSKPRRLMLGIQFNI